MLKSKGNGSVKSIGQSLLFTISCLLSINSWSVTGSDISLIDLMIDSYEMKMITWADKHAYSMDGPGIDVRPQEVSMHQNMRHLDEYADSVTE